MTEKNSKPARPSTEVEPEIDLRRGDMERARILADAMGELSSIARWKAQNPHQTADPGTPIDIPLDKVGARVENTVARLESSVPARGDSESLPKATF